MRTFIRIYRKGRRRKHKKASAASRKQYLEHKERARELIKQKIERYNQFYNFKFNRIFVKNHRSRWGSCSKRGNLNFNYRLALIPEDLLEYVVVHELCHLGQLNHSKKFWDLVAKTMPDWPERRRRLYKIHH